MGATVKPIKGCSCRKCRSGLHGRRGEWVARNVARRYRRMSKAALKRGVEPPQTISRGYTD